MCRDWVPPPPAAAVTPHLTSAFSYIANLEQFLEFAQATGNTVDYAKYSQLYTSLIPQYNTAFFKNAQNFYDTGITSARDCGTNLA